MGGEFSVLLLAWIGSDPAPNKMVLVCGNKKAGTARFFIAFKEP